jgi:maleylacetate reductase
MDRVASALGKRYAGRFDECREHSPLESVIACLGAVRRASPDLLVTIGGGSVIDTAKIVQLGLTHGIHTLDELLERANKPTPGPSKIRQLIVPTTLSGSEFTNSAGSPDKRRKLKVGFSTGDICGHTIVLDPALSLHTPEKLWYSTAVRSIDHAIESFCAGASNPYIRANTWQAVRWFFSSLRRTKENPHDLDARLSSQQAVWLARKGYFAFPWGRATASAISWGPSVELRTDTRRASHCRRFCAGTNRSTASSSVSSRKRSANPARVSRIPWANCSTVCACPELSRTSESSPR